MKVIVLQSRITARHRLKLGDVLDAGEFDDREIVALVRDHILDVFDVDTKETG